MKSLFYALCMLLGSRVRADSPSVGLSGAQIVACPDNQNAVFLYSSKRLDCRPTFVATACDGTASGGIRNTGGAAMSTGKGFVFGGYGYCNGGLGLQQYWNVTEIQPEWLEVGSRISPKRSSAENSRISLLCCRRVSLVPWPSYQVDPAPASSLLQLDLLTSKWIAGPPYNATVESASSSSLPTTTPIAGGATAAIVALAVCLMLIRHRRRRSIAAKASKAPSVAQPEPPTLLRRRSTSSTWPPSTPAPPEHADYPDAPPAYYRGIVGLPRRIDPVVAESPDQEIVYRGLCEFRPRASGEVAISLGDEIVVR
ncbi:hypothetical protein BDK51DRAFT_49111 [Blyttiomyces helicus]|uniref:Uncharacterized protein n=1 Tax=Blyttiomyces helicus TaxID=388810 RepID=A0A4P9VXE4_9FUNG|nr:hypothetical protein BDK51DRAFT_49111 [Blyttiomyces helicus]|eukprot:RKO84389.1 hypothetical protein BDK51DRAFT_49111 [Blyttiomyces helicus]